MLVTHRDRGEGWKAGSLEWKQNFTPAYTPDDQSYMVKKLFFLSQNSKYLFKQYGGVDAFKELLAIKQVDPG